MRPPPRRIVPVVVVLAFVASALRPAAARADDAPPGAQAEWSAGVAA